MSATEAQTTPPTGRAFQLAGLGLPIVVLGFITYFIVFVDYPLTRDFPWVSIPIMLFGLWLAWKFYWRSRTHPSRWKRVYGWLQMTAAFFLSALFGFYIFSYSYQLPSANSTLAQGATPTNFTLKDHEGNDVSLTDFRGQTVIVCFYRGHW